MQSWWSAVLVALIVCGHSTAQTQKPQTTVSGLVQTGFAETFQLTLGGMFGDGPAFQNRGVLNVNNIFRKNDAVSTFGWMTFDGPSHMVNSQAGISYKARLLDKKSNVLIGSLGYQRWDFPSVLQGTHDNLLAGNLTWQTRAKSIPVTITADTWRLLTSDFPIGSLLYVQAWTTHTLWSNDHGRLVLRPTLATTYSWNFYGKNGARVFRYGGITAWEGHNYSIEGGVRQQVALQPGIPENSFWSIGITRLF